jgi:hypothetical protein
MVKKLNRFAALAVLRKRRRRQIPELRAVELLEQAFAVQGLHFRAVQLEGVAASTTR